MYPGMQSMLPIMPMAPGSSVVHGTSYYDPAVLAAALGKIKKRTEDGAKDDAEKEPTDIAQTIINQQMKLQQQMLQMTTTLDKIAAKSVTTDVQNSCSPVIPLQAFPSKSWLSYA